ncbi:MAG TPA: retropepsin-like aspartic protease [Kofleriaceae bacterium]|nr:retropepsin-like aspartic protease [Kofleriaceae bacterium]
MKVARFRARADLIIVRARLRGPLRPRGRTLRLVLDTGAAETIISPEVLDELGYSPRDGEAITVMRSVAGHEHGYMIRVDRIDCLGHRSADFRVNAQDLPEGWNIEAWSGSASCVSSTTASARARAASSSSAPRRPS